MVRPHALKIVSSVNAPRNEEWAGGVREREGRSERARGRQQVTSSWRSSTRARRQALAREGAPIAKRRERHTALQQCVAHPIARTPELEGEHTQTIARERANRLRAYASVCERETEREIMCVGEEVSGRGRKRERERGRTYLPETRRARRTPVARCTPGNVRE